MNVLEAMLQEMNIHSEVCIKKKIMGKIQCGYYFPKIVKKKSGRQEGWTQCFTVFKKLILITISMMSSKSVQ